MTDTIYSLFEKTAKRCKNEIAVIENGRRLTFGELSDMVDILASTFPKNVSSVGIVMGHKAEMITGILAVLKCGAKYIPAEPKFPTGRIHYMMKEANVDFILTEKEYESKLEGFPVRLLECEICGMDIPAATQPTAEDPNLPAYILYTSGTTGTPKGVCVTNRNVCHYVRAFAHEFHPSVGDIMLQYSVCTFDIFVEEVFGSLLSGAALAIPTEDDMADIHSLMSFVQRHHVTMLSGFPYLLAEMNHLDKIPVSLRLLISGGDVLRGVYVDHLLEQAEVYNTYGPSETTVCASYYRCNDETILSDGTYPIGKAVKGTQIRILDQSGRELKNGETGEICIYGDGVSLGYIGKHDEENKAFEPLENGGVLYRSGDLGYVLPSGDIAFLHRKDTQVMIYGKRVEVSEVEARLYQCRGVQQALVRAFTDEAGLSYMIAYVVFTEQGGKVSSLREELAENLTSYMIPEFIVKMPKIPLNANGKPDIARLPIVMKEGNF
ncbi:amino acid adenylation domain-containing protein [Ruminococcus gauvreauii]|uniref:Amino acid adenylation domain-containing protein n=1 Tax=Ruminococcus gauvreauii TaxID=438033 RepID=A0ABY5VGX9_9FIRM|nr:amino acid adenylation domain-containing protein [Ruminococcus gauvreauii]UWP59849.1 amino acid adenylation domain-containing protein [Ruminococcus gauvreauii]